MDEKNENLTGLEKLIEYVRKHFWTWFVYIITTSLVGLVICSLIFKNSLELKNISDWVGVILGLVALVATVFSLGLSFYNYDKQMQLDLRNKELMEQIYEQTKNAYEQAKITNEQLAHYDNKSDRVIISEKSKEKLTNNEQLKEVSIKLNNLSKKDETE